VDNCPAHPTNIPLENIKLVILLPNATDKLQHLDQGFVNVLKQKYLVKKLTYSMHYTMYMQQGIRFTANVVENCFRKAKFVEGNSMPWKKAAKAYNNYKRSFQDIHKLTKT
jgi:hypothetical protein